MCRVKEILLTQSRQPNGRSSGIDGDDISSPEMTGIFFGRSWSLVEVVVLEALELDDDGSDEEAGRAGGQVRILENWRRTRRLWHTTHL
jgi:hypothetical protein